MPTSPKPTLLQISNALGLRYEKTGDRASAGPHAHDPHTARIFSQSWRPSSPGRIRFMQSISLDTVIRQSTRLAPFDEPYFRQGIIPSSKSSTSRRHARRRIDRGCIGPHGCCSQFRNG